MALKISVRVVFRLKERLTLASDINAARWLDPNRRDDDVLDILHKKRTHISGASADVDQDAYVTILLEIRTKVLDMVRRRETISWYLPHMRPLPRLDVVRHIEPPLWALSCSR